ncbi:MAG TPA: NIL domain-containing protein [Armatimonadaceae bacterium]|nr:NIL domain-containing protein [Armatimonadaceae bacterium]
MDNETETIRVQLNFPLEQVKKPIIWHLAHDYGLMFSIRRASIDIHAGGFTVLELTGTRDNLDRGLEWVRQEGVEVSAIGLDGTDEWVVR